MLSWECEPWDYEPPSLPLFSRLGWSLQDDPAEHLLWNELAWGERVRNGKWSLKNGTLLYFLLLLLWEPERLDFLCWNKGSLTPTAPVPESPPLSPMAHSCNMVATVCIWKHPVAMEMAVTSGIFLNWLIAFHYKQRPKVLKHCTEQETIKICTYKRGSWLISLLTLVFPSLPQLRCCYYLSCIV